MFTTGSKLLLGSTGAAVVFAVIYGITVGGTLGVFGLLSAAVALALIAGINIYSGDANVAIDDTAAATLSAAARQAPAGSPWPVVGAIGIALVAVGLVSTAMVTIVGLVVILAAVIEWMVQAWAEHGSADEAYNGEIRARMANPLEMPILATIFAAIVIVGFSRIMLALTKVGTVVAFSVIAAVVLFIAYLMAARPGVAARTLGGVVAIGVLALVAGGAVAAVSGERKMHVIETTAALAERGRCGVEPSEADKKASQTVAAKSNQAATVTLTAQGTLNVAVPGFNQSASRVTLPRSNPNNVLFRNDSDHERRLVIDIGPFGDMESKTLCTALVEPGAVQLLTVLFDKPSFAVDGGHQFRVPGVDTAVLEVVVP
jgi:hypothetical protein